jgi:uncharacterized protein (TIGR03905 family)
MKKIEYYTSGTCSSKVTLDIEGTVIKSACFEGGCDGNLVAICKLIAGMDAREVARRLRGVDCGGKGTSCPDQLAQAIDENLQQIEK